MVRICDYSAHTDDITGRIERTETDQHEVTSVIWVNK